MPSFWRQLIAALRRDTPAFQPERPRSPIELYEAGGGDINTANERTRRLLLDAEHSWQRHQDRHDGPVRPTCADPKATRDVYVDDHGNPYGTLDTPTDEPVTIGETHGHLAYWRVGDDHGICNTCGVVRPLAAFARAWPSGPGCRVCGAAPTPEEGTSR